MLLIKSIPEQLTDIYYKYEDWHSKKLPYDEAIKYHQTRYENEDIKVYQEAEEVLGYYERYYSDNICILYNVWVKEDCRKGKVFKELYKHFFATMPDNIEFVVGEKQRLGGKIMRERIRRKHGKH